MNPYDPGIPATPDRFAGRQSLLERTTELLDKAEGRRSNAAVLLHGHRGSGKTSALRKVEALSAGRFPRSVVVEIPLRQRQGEAALLSDIADEVRRFADRRKDSDSYFRGLHHRLSSISLSVLGTGVAVTRAEPRVTNPLTLWKATVVAIAEAPLIAIAIDDAELIDEPGLGTLKTIAESDLGVPVLLLVAGGPDLWRSLSGRGGSPVARIFSGTSFEIAGFSLSETSEALEAPLRSLGHRAGWTPAAVERVQALSHGNPYLVQCLAEAAFREGTIERSDVEASVGRALEIAGPWLLHELEHASDLDIRSFLRVAELGRPILTTGEILEAGVLPPYIPRLVRLGVLEQLARGRFALQKPPVIAYFHALRRGIA